MKVKICGITSIDDALFCEECGVNAIGFIFYKKSERYIEPAKAKKIIEKLNPFTLKVGVFVNESPDIINEIAKVTGINIVQLHGDEKPDIAEKIYLPIIKAFRVKPGFNYDEIDQWGNNYILLDAYSKNLYGGTGKTIDLSGIPEDVYIKSILAGGIGLDNIKDIIKRKIFPVAVDISSSVEKKPGIKDLNKIKEFMNIIRIKE